jgi:hypothetical protein
LPLTSASRTPNRVSGEGFTTVTVRAAMARLRTVYSAVCGSPWKESRECCREGETVFLEALTSHK